MKVKIKITHLHHVHPIRNILKLSVGAAGSFIEYERVEVMAQAKRDVKGRKDAHESGDDDEGPVVPLLGAGAAPEERADAHPEGDEVDAVRDGLHEERNDLRFADGELGVGSHGCA